jgi:glutamate racemase
VRRCALNAANRLAAGGIKLMVVACNTATSYALDALTGSSPVPVVGPQVRLVDSARAVADAVFTEYSGLIDTTSGRPGTVHIQLTDASDRFLRIAVAILGREPQHLEVVDI